MAQIGYVRVSRKTQNPASQVNQLLRLGIAAPDIFIDDGISGTVVPEKRPVFCQMIERLKAGDVDTLYVSELSRIGRTIEDSLLTILGLRQQGIIIRSLSIHEKFINDMPSELQPVLMSAMLYVATLERKMLAERTRRGVHHARDQGKSVGRPRVTIDWERLQEIQARYNLREKQAARVLGYSPNTLYRYKRLRPEGNVPPAGE